MAQGRMLLKKISTSKPVNDFSNDTSRMLFSWAIAHLDVAGRMHGDLCVFRSTVAPRLPHITDETVERCFAEWEAAGLVTRYEAKGDWWLQFNGFHENQVGLRVSKEAPSYIPEPTPDLLRSRSGPTPSLPGLHAGRSAGVREGKGREGKGSARAREEPPPQDSRSWVVSWYRAFTERTAQTLEPSTEAFTEGAAAWKRSPPETLVASVPVYFRKEGFWFTKPRHGTRPEYSFRNYLGHLDDVISAISPNGKARVEKDLTILRCPDGHPYLAAHGMCLECGWTPPKEEDEDGPDFG